MANNQSLLAKPIMSFYRRITVYHYMIVILSFLAIYYIVRFGRYEFLPQVILAPVLAALAELAFVKYKRQKLFFPSSAIITGLFAASILGTLSLAVSAAVIAIVVKKILRVHNRHIFNPAASGIIIVSLIAGLFRIVDTSPALWWSASTFLIIPLGIFIAWKIKRLYVALPLLAIYFSLSLLTDFFSGIQVTPFSLFDVTVLFLAFFMAVEPRTSPTTRNGKIIFATIIAVVFFLGRFLPISGITLDWALLSLMFANLFTRVLNEKF